MLKAFVCVFLFHHNSVLKLA